MYPYSPSPPRTIRYEKQHAADGKRLESFFEYTLGYCTHPEVAAWDSALRAARDERWAQAARH